MVFGPSPNFVYLIDLPLTDAPAVQALTGAEHLIAALPAAGLPQAPQPEPAPAPAEPAKKAVKPAQKSKPAAKKRKK